MCHKYFNYNEKYPKCKTTLHNYESEQFVLPPIIEIGWEKKRNSVHTCRNSVNYRYQYPSVPDLSVVTASKNTN